MALCPAVNGIEATMKRAHLANTYVAALAFVAAFSYACQTAPQPPPSSPPVLTPQVLAPTNLANYSPNNPYRQLVPGLMVRTLYVAETRGPNRIQVWELLVGPGQKTGAFTLPGSGVLSISSGQGIVTTAGASREVRTGETTVVDEGAEIQIENRTDGAGLMIQATLVTRSGN